MSNATGVPAVNKGGRPTVCTPTTANALVERLAAGEGIGSASAAVGVSEKAVYNWLRWGTANPDGPFGDFARRVAAVREQAEAAILAAWAESQSGGGSATVFAGRTAWRTVPDAADASNSRAKWSN